MLWRRGEGVYLVITLSLMFGAKKEVGAPTHLLHHHPHLLLHLRLHRLHHRRLHRLRRA